MNQDKEQIREGNITIAKFCNGELKDIDDVDCIYFRKPNGNLLNTCRVDKLKYHSSWDWLMPIVEKIELTGYMVCIEKNGCTIYKEYGHPISVTNLWPTKIEATYVAVLSFLEWYEKIK